MHDIAINRKVLEKNIAFAEKNRVRLRQMGVHAINLISSPGSGKTSIIERTLEALDGSVRVAVIVGDIQGDFDVQRLARFGVPSRQINTGRSCHLDAHMIHHSLPWLAEQGNLDLLIIENVGNMVCPAEYDLGEAMKVSVMSVTEGDDKPLKYPAMFHASACLLINKTDLLPYTDFNIGKARENALSLNPRLKIIETSCRKNEGIGEWAKLLEDGIRLLGSGI